MANRQKSSEKTNFNGSCSFERVNPAREELNSKTQKLNLVISFEEGLKLQFAIHERLRAIHQLKMSAADGKRAAVNLVVDLTAKSIAVMPGKLSKKKK